MPGKSGDLRAGQIVHDERISLSREEFGVFFNVPRWVREIVTPRLHPPKLPPHVHLFLMPADTME